MMTLTPCPECGALGWVEPCSSCRDIRENNRDRAVVARIGGNEYRRRFANRGGAYFGSLADTDRWVAEEAASLAANRSHRKGDEHCMWPRSFAATLPEAAFDWPIYRAALYRYGELKRAEVEALHRYGERTFGDAWWPGQSRDGYSPEDAAVLDEMGYFAEEPADV